MSGQLHRFNRALLGVIPDEWIDYDEARKLNGDSKMMRASTAQVIRFFLARGLVEESRTLHARLVRRTEAGRAALDTPPHA